MLRYALTFVVLVAALSLPVAGRAQTDTIREDAVRREKRKPKLTKPPTLQKFVEASYPKEALRDRVEGKVEMLVTLDAKGKVTAVKVMKAPSAALGLAAERAVRQFEFSPAEVDGKPSPIQIRYNYNFVLQRSFRPRIPAWLNEQAERSAGADVLVGQVREQGTRLPLAGVAVAIPALGIEVKSDGRGRFSIPDLPAGEYEAVAVSLQHHKESVNIEISEGQQTRVKFYLRPLTSNPYETVVRGKRRQTTVSRITLRKRQLTTVPGTFGDPVRVVQNLPGVARTPYVGGALLVRGAAPQDSGVFLDGIRMPILFHFLGGPSVLNPQFLDQIDYYPGNADVRYNRLIAGVVDVSTRDTFTEQLHGSVDINLLNAAVFLDVPVTDNISVAGAVRRSYVDALLPAVFDATGLDATSVVPVYYDYQGRVDIKLGGDDRLWVLGFGSLDDLSIASSEPDQTFAVDLSSLVTFHRLLVGYKAFFWDGRGRSKLTPYVGYDLVNFDTGGANVDITSWLFGVRENVELKLSERWRLRTGADLKMRLARFEAQVPIPAPYRNPAAPVRGQRNFANAFTDEVHPIDVSQWLGSIGLYVDSIVDVTDRLKLIPGVRFDLFFYQDNNIRPFVAPRVTARYKLFEPTVLKAAAGLFSQAPQPNQSNRVVGNPKLVLEKAAHFALGFEQQLFLPALSLDVEGYYIHRYDQGVRSDEVIFDGSQIRPLRYTNQGLGMSYGVQVMLKHEVTRHFYGWIAYTLSRSQRRLRPGEDFVRFLFDQTHILTLVGSFRFGSGWEAGFRFRVVTGRPDTPVLGGVFDGDGNFYRRIESPEERTANLPTFHQLDLRLEKTWIFELWRLSAYLSVQNVYNAKNPEAILYDYRFRQSGPLRGLPFLPTIGVKGAF